MDLTIILTVGKYAILVAIYAFVLVVFRGIIGQLAAESRRSREAAGSAEERRRVSRRKRRVLSGSEPAPELRPKPAPVPTETHAEPEPPAEPEPVSAPEPEPAPAAAAPERPPRVDLLAEEAEEVIAVQPQAPPEPEPEPEPAPAPAPEPPAATSPAAAHLLVLESSDETLEVGETIALSAAVTIGRSEENSLQVADRFVSSKHALVCLRDGARILVDRGSTNGTFVNGDRVEDEVELSEGDRIALGNTVLEYHA